MTFGMTFGVTFRLVLQPPPPTRKRRMAEPAQFNVVLVYKNNGADVSARLECSSDTTAKDLLTRCSLDSKLWRLRISRGSKGWLQDDQPLRLRGVESGWQLRASTKVDKEQQARWRTLRKDAAPTSSHQQSRPDPTRRTHHSKKLKVKDVMRKLKLKLKVKLKLKLKKATSQFPPGGQTPEKLINAKKQKKLTTNEKELTKEEVAAKNLEIRLLKPVAGFAKAAMDSDTEAEFHQDSVNNPMLLLKAAAAADAAQPSRQDRTQPLNADLDCYKNYEDQAWLAHAYSTGSEEWLAPARSEGLFCECCWPRSLRSSSMMGLGVWGGAGGQGPGRNQLGRPSLG